MKRIFFTILAVAFIVISVKSFAQIVPNEGFEDWTTVTSYMDPDDWSTSNATSTQFGFGITVSRSDSFHTGTYALQLQSASNGASQFPGVVTNGIATIGLGTLSIVGGSPWLLRSSKMSGFFEYNSGGAGDSALITVILFKRLPTGRDTIAVGKKILGSQVGYSQFDVNLTYQDWSLNPDSVLILMQSSKALLGAQAGTWFRVDDLSFSGTVPAGVKNVNPESFSVSVYPNPATETVNFSISNSKNAKTLSIYDILGKKIKTVEIASALISVSTEGLNNSLYFYQVADSNNQIISTGKFSVKK